MLFDTFSNQTDTVSGEDPFDDRALTPPPGVKVFKPELHANRINNVSAWELSKQNIEATDISVRSACADTQSDTESEPNDDTIALSDADHTAHDQVSAGTASSSEAAVITSADNTSSDTVEPVPSLFEGIGINRPAAISVTECSPYDAATEAEPPSNDGNTADATIVPDETAQETEPEDEVDVLELLDYIDDIEFSGMEPEPLRAVQYADSTQDPYNTSFNDPDSSSTDMPAEFSIAPDMIFEKK